ncbi:MAG: serine hydrolase domain-containing protein [Clostridia bacterium]|nr:serine hydrolase domain-containing protein [Clostridia bacterium]
MAANCQPNRSRREEWIATKRRLAVLTVLVIVAQLLAGIPQASARAATPYDNAIATARLEIWKALSNGASAATVAIMDDSTIVYSEGFGMRSREESIPVDTDTQFNIGSISKVFATASILLLCDDGRVELDKPVTTYLPEFTMEDPRYAGITVRMLLNHSSGMPGTYIKTGFGAKKNRNYVAEALAELAHSNLKHDPGDVSVYCNDGFTVSEAIVERVSGMSYADFLETRIFSQASMNHSSCYFENGNANIARRYDITTGRALPAEYVNLLGSGGIASTAEDLCRFSRVLWADTLLEPSVLEEFTKPQYGPKTVPQGTPQFAFGLGWDSVELEAFARQGKKVIVKNGRTQQFISQLCAAPDEKLSVAVIFADPTAPASICTQIMQALMEGKGILNPDEQSVRFPPRSAAIPSELLKYEGYYGTSGGIMKVEFDTEANVMKASAYCNGQFVPVSQFMYAEDGCFHIDETEKLSLAEAFGTKFIMTHRDDLVGSTVAAQEIPQRNAVFSGRLFENKTWLPRNLTCYEFGPLVAVSGVVKELPGYVHFIGAPYALTDEHTASMALSHARDQMEPKITERGEELWLETQACLFSDASQAAPLDPGEKISIGSDSYNEWRKVQTQGVFNTDIPTRGRVLVFSPAGELTYDSLMDGQKALLLEEGSYVGFIGEPGDLFVPVHQPRV